MAVAYIRFAAVATATVSGSATICSGTGTTIQAALTGTPPWSLAWSDGVLQSDLLTSPATRVVSPGTTTTYTVTAVSDANGSGSASGGALISVNTLPATPVITAPSIVGAGSPNRTAGVPPHAGSTYSWTIGNGTITAGQGINQITFTGGTAGTPLTLSVTETNASGCVSVAGTATVTVLSAGSGLQFYTVIPCRVADTRVGSGFSSGYGTPSIGGGASRDFVVAGQCGIPAGALAVSFNFTVWNTTSYGDFKIYPGGGTVSTAV